MEATEKTSVGKRDGRMKIALCYSMQFAKEAKEVAEFFAKLGHEAHPSRSNERYLGLSDDEAESLKLDDKYNRGALKEHCETIKNCDAVLVLNYTRNGIENYIGGNAFLEMGYAHILAKPIFLLNPIPKIAVYETEIIAMKPVVVFGNLSKVVGST